MRSKHIVALSTFFAAFALSILVVGLFFGKAAIAINLNKTVQNTPCSAGMREKILDLLQQDKENGELRDFDEFSLYDQSGFFPTLSTKSKIVSAYVERSNSLDTQGLPKDFQIAWRKHMNAWISYSKFLERAEKAEVSALDVQRLKQRYHSDIDTTWEEVLRIADSYDAEFSE